MVVETTQAGLQPVVLGVDEAAVRDLVDLELGEGSRIHGSLGLTEDGGLLLYLR